MSYVKTLAVGLALAALLAGPQQAFAAETTWPLQSPSAVLLAYGEAYSGRTHSGVDLRAGAGDRVVAPCAASVAFAGRVPAGVGQTCLAITLALPDGRSMTLMPLATAAVTAGSEVGAGAKIGEIAAAGDGSCAESHLHVGLRRGDTYLDPMTLLVAPVVGASEPQPQAASSAEAPVVGGAASPSPVAVAPAPVAGGVSAPEASGATAGSGCQAGASAAAVTAPSATLVGAHTLAPTRPLAHASTPAPAHAPARGQMESPASVQVPSTLTASDATPRSASPGAATKAEPAPVAQLPAGVSLAASTSRAQIRSRAAAPAHGAPAADASLKRARAAVWSSATSTFADALGIAHAVAIELALVALGITGAAIRKRPLITPAPASVRPVEDAIAAAADRCYTRRAHFLLRAQPSQSRSRIVQRR
jgi:hypothetical protein